MFRVMKLGRYVLVDDGGINYVTFHKLYVRIKIFKKCGGLNRLCSSAIRLSKFVYF